MKRRIIPIAFSLAASCYLSAAAVPAQAANLTDIRLDTPSGLPVPRYASLKSKKTYCRAGPSFNHPVRITFLKRALPVLIIAETNDHWRKISDPEGDECWVHKTKLSGAQTVLVVSDGVALRTRPSPEAPARARLGRGLIAHIEADKDNGWLKLSAAGMTGWSETKGFWGPSSPGLAAPRN